MKSILLASVSAFAFAGAAAADVAWSGSASASYNTITGFDSSASMDASASAALDNGWTATVTVSVDLDGFGSSSYVDGSPIMGSCVTGITVDSTGTAGDTDTLPDLTYAPCVVGYTPGSFTAGTNGISYGAISLTDGTSTLTFGANHAFGAAGLDDEDVDAKSADVTVSTTMGGVGISASFDAATDGNTEIGVTMSAGGADIEAGFVAAGADAGDFRLGLSTSVGGADIAFNTSSVGGTTAWDASLGMSLAGADLSFSTDDSGDWDLGVSYTMGDLTVSAGIDETPGNYTVGVDYAAGGVGVSFSTDQANDWAASVSYTEGAISVSAAFDVDGLGAVEGSYDMGGGMVAYFGAATNNYAGLEMDLGGGASLAVSYADGAGSDDDAKNYAEGGTVAVSFDF